MATELLQIQTASARAAAICGFVATAKECVRLRNYNDAFCVVAGLDSAAIKRLTVGFKPLCNQFTFLFLFFR